MCETLVGCIVNRCFERETALLQEGVITLDMREFCVAVEHFQGTSMAVAAKWWIALLSANPDAKSTGLDGTAKMSLSSVMVLEQCSAEDGEKLKKPKAKRRKLENGKASEDMDEVAITSMQTHLLEKAMDSCAYLPIESPELQTVEQIHAK
jgi:hypothetical protein